jgi:hypothetical protein
LIPNGERKSLRTYFCTSQYGKDMPVAYGESERVLGKVFSLAGDNLEAIVQEINPLPFSILKPWILIQIESFHNSMSRRHSSWCFGDQRQFSLLDLLHMLYKTSFPGSLILACRGESI